MHQPMTPEVRQKVQLYEEALAAFHGRNFSMAEQLLGALLMQEPSLFLSIPFSFYSNSIQFSAFGGARRQGGLGITSEGENGTALPRQMDAGAGDDGEMTSVLETRHARPKTHQKSLKES